MEIQAGKEVLIPDGQIDIMSHLVCHFQFLFPFVKVHDNCRNVNINHNYVVSMALFR